MSEHRDSTVGDALRRLDVPDHAPGFWDRLDARLTEPADATTPSLADAVVPPDGEVVELGSAPSRRRHLPGPRPILALVAAAAAVAALVVGVTAFRAGDDAPSRVDTADPSPADPGPGSTAPPEEPDGPEPDGGQAVQPALQAEETATGWLTLLRAGEVEEAHARLDATSRAALPLEEFRQVATGLAEGASAFAGEGVTSDVLRIPGDAATYVVVFAGEVEREGMVETAAYPVVVTGVGDEPGIAFSFDGPSLELDEPAPGDTWTSPVVVRVGTDRSWFAVDGGELQPIEQSPISIDVEGLAGAGTHALTVVTTDGERYTTRSVTVVVP